MWGEWTFEPSKSRWFVKTKARNTASRIFFEKYSDYLVHPTIGFAVISARYNVGPYTFSYDSAAEGKDIAWSNDDHSLKHAVITHHITSTRPLVDWALGTDVYTPSGLTASLAGATSTPPTVAAAVTAWKPVVDLNMVVANIQNCNYTAASEQLRIKDIISLQGEIPKYRYTSPFGMRHISGFGIGFHQGVDIGAPEGTNMYAPFDTKVYDAGNGGSLGNFVGLVAPDGGFLRFGHMSRVVVRAGQVLRKGDLIGTVGNTGHSKGAHLHLDWQPAAATFNMLPALDLKAMRDFPAASFAKHNKFRPAEWIVPLRYIFYKEGL